MTDLSGLDTATARLEADVDAEIAHDKSMATEINDLNAHIAQLSQDGVDTVKLSSLVSRLESKAALLEADVAAASGVPTPAPAPPAVAAGDQITSTATLGTDAAQNQPPAPVG